MTSARSRWPAGVRPKHRPLPRASSRPVSRRSRRAARRSTTSTCSRSPTATPATTWCSRCARCSRSSTGSTSASEERTIDDIGRDEIVASVARAALLGARGNSGVILSQLIRGAAEELASRPGELVDPVLIGAALARAADQAYGSVRDPAEGTILTVVREMARPGRVRARAHARRAARRRTPSADEQDAVIADVIERALEAGQESVKRGPDLLPVLREAGVVDAGGYALTVLLAGIVGALRGSEPPPLEHHAPARVTHPQHASTHLPLLHELRRHRHRASSSDGSSGRSSGSATRCWSSATRRRSRSTSTPTIPTPRRRCSRTPARSRTSTSPTCARRSSSATSASPARRAGGRCGALAVTTGDGMRPLFESLGVRALDGGPTLNPSTYELLAAIHAVAGRGGRGAAQQPERRDGGRARRRAVGQDGRASSRRARPQAGLAAAVSLDPARSAEENAAAMTQTLERVRTGAVAPAARDDAQGRFREGDAVGFVDDEIVVWGRPREALRGVLERLAEDAELITCLRGAEAPLDDETVAGAGAGEVEFELSDGGQPSYWWLLSAE